MTLRAALSDALLTTLAAPATWPMALATFLLRGGVFVVALPIVVLPSPVGLGNLIAPTLIDVAFQGVTPEVAALVGALVAAFVGWLIVGGLVAGALEAAAARIVVRNDVYGQWRGEEGLPPQGNRVPARIFAARVIAHVPTAAVFIWASTRLVAVAYRELTSPLDVTTPIAIRVIRGAPEAVALVTILWIVGEVAGALAARRIVIEGEALAHALRGAFTTVLRSPMTLGAFVVPLAGLLVLVLLPGSLAASASWTAVQATLQGSDNMVWATFLVVVFVSLWLAGLALVAVLSAWRAAVWTVLARHLGSIPVAAPAREAG